MKKILLIFPLFVFLISCAQQPASKFYFPEVGWKITLPDKFKLMDSSANAALNAKGQKEIEESNHMKVEDSQTKTFFSAIKQPRNYFSATITAYDPAKDGDFNATIESLKGLTYNTFKTQIHNSTVDSSSSHVAIDGIDFDKCQIAVQIDNKTLFNMVLLSKYYKGYEFSISYLYADEDTKKEIESSLNSSRFNQ